MDGIGSLMHYAMPRNPRVPDYIPGSRAPARRSRWHPGSRVMASVVTGRQHSHPGRVCGSSASLPTHADPARVSTARSARSTRSGRHATVEDCAARQVMAGGRSQLRSRRPRLGVRSSHRGVSRSVWAAFTRAPQLEADLSTSTSRPGELRRSSADDRCAVSRPVRSPAAPPRGPATASRSVARSPRMSGSSVSDDLRIATERSSSALIRRCPTAIRRRTLARSARGPAERMPVRDRRSRRSRTSSIRRRSRCHAGSTTATVRSIMFNAARNETGCSGSRRAQHTNLGNRPIP
jgi:hypothetical protein